MHWHLVCQCIYLVGKGIICSLPSTARDLASARSGLIPVCTTMPLIYNGCWLGFRTIFLQA